MLAIPSYWVRPSQKLESGTGMHRFLWDLHYPPVPSVRPDYPIAAVYRNTAPAPTSPWAMPGKYAVTLTVNRKTYSQTLIVKMDPRVQTSTADLAEQFKSSQQLYDQWLALGLITESARSIRGQFTELRPRAPEGELKTSIDPLSEKIQALAGAAGPGPGGAAAAAGQPARATVASVTARLRTLFNDIEGVDAAPTPQLGAAAVGGLKDARLLLDSLQSTVSNDVSALNENLRGAR